MRRLYVHFHFHSRLFCKHEINFIDFRIQTQTVFIRIKIRHVAMQFLVVVNRIQILDFDSLLVELFNEGSHNLVVEDKQIFCLIRQRNSTCFVINHFFAQLLRQFYDVIEFINHQMLDIDSNVMKALHSNKLFSNNNCKSRIILEQILEIHEWDTFVFHHFVNVIV
jgi:hypothetical protein